ncbi:MAG: alpha/beta hydrolase [Actinobacteria bacterium 13_2_20CM_2_71_6]|nr:MAG: alpha/beta hydrolase [Actinobacteria bacterium 13_2_20CM_2_71_6]
MVYVLIPGAGGDAWYWHLVERELDQRGHDAISVELPSDDDSAGLADYTDTVIEAIGERSDVVLVAQSMAGVVAPLVQQRHAVLSIILVNAMIPLPGESPGAWWDNTGQPQARQANDVREGRPADAEFDLATYFFHDVPPEIAEYGMSGGKRQADRPFGDACSFSAWPQVPTHVITGRDDRFFPLEFQQRIARERLGLEPDIVPGGHLVALSHPIELVDRIESYKDV